jgi:hypothetical protein
MDRQMKATLEHSASRLSSKRFAIFEGGFVRFKVTHWVSAFGGSSGELFS